MKDGKWKEAVEFMMERKKKGYWKEVEDKKGKEEKI